MIKKIYSYSLYTISKTKTSFVRSISMGLATVLLISLLGFGNKLQAQCSVTISQNGNTISFVPLWALAGIYSLDSVRVNWGDATTNLYVTPNIGTPNHTYANPGAYQMCLTRYISSLGNPGVAIPCTYCDSVFISGSTTSNPCNLNAAYTSTTNNNVVTFSNTTTCPSCISLTTSWNYGDGTPNSTIYQGSHTYANPGTYTTCLVMTAINPNNVTCIDTFCSTFTIGTTPPPPCAANATFTQNTQGSIVAFTNNSTCVGCTSFTYSWNFGDGSPASNATSPTHTYANAGTYNACLIMTAVSGSTTCTDTFCLPVTIQPTVLCGAQANYTSTNSFAQYNFTNTSTCNSCVSATYAWTFGDGGTSSAQNATHTYNANGTYTVCLKITGVSSSNNTCIDSICKVVSVILNGVKDIKTNSLEIFPNPTNNSVWVQLPVTVKSEKINLLDVTGRKLKTIELSSQKDKVQISLQEFSSGTFFIELITNKEKFISTITKTE